MSSYKDKPTQHSILRNWARSPRSVTPLRLNGQLPLLTRAHIQKTLIPSFNNLARADGEREGLSAVVRCVEFRAVGFEGAAVVHVDLVAGLGLARAAGGLGDFGLEVFVVDDFGGGEGGAEEGEGGGQLHSGGLTCFLVYSLGIIRGD